MTMPEAHEPAFIVNSKLGSDAAFSPSVGPREAPTDSYLTSSPDSRSTSTGSLSPLPSTIEGETEVTGLPDYDYPVPLFVRNTFIDAGVSRPISLDEFFQERRVQSSPVECPPGLCSNPGFVAMHTGAMHQALPAGSPMMDSVFAAALAASAQVSAAAAAAAARCWMPSMNLHCQGSPMPSSPDFVGGMQSPMFNCPVPRDQAPVLRLAEALDEPILEFGSPEMPTVGSAWHRAGNCKPCAFFHTRGCGNGTQCQFCHLCAPGEKKRRQKDKGAVHREMRRMGLMPDIC